MYRNSIFAGLLALIFLGACETGPKKTESGLEYEYVRKGTGIKGDSGLILLMNISYVDENDSTIFNSTESGIPTSFNYPHNQTGKFMEAVQMLKEGDSMKFKMTAFDFFITSFRRPVPPEIDSSSYITFNIGVEKILNREEHDAYSLELNTRLRKEAEERAKVQLQEDIAEIEAYLAENEIQAERTESGIFYVMNEEGEGESVQRGQQATVNYTGYLLDGAYFDTSIEEIAREQDILRPGGYQPFTFTVGMGQVIPGWDEGLTLMKKGGKATIYIPSPLAYGERRRSEVIAENSILVFDIELLEIIEN